MDSHPSSPERLTKDPRLLTGDDRWWEVFVAPDDQRIVNEYVPNWRELGYTRLEVVPRSRADRLAEALEGMIGLFPFPPGERVKGPLNEAKAALAHHRDSASKEEERDG